MPTRFDTSRSSRRPFRTAVLTLAAAAACTAASAQAATPLAETYRTLQAELARSPFGAPVVLRSGDAADRPQGDVYAVIEQPFAVVRDAFRRSDSWCSVMRLQTNVKTCRPGTDRLQVGVVRKSEQTAEDAQRIDFSYTVHSASDDRLVATLTAAQGPVGTRDYRIGLEAVPIAGGHTFLHLSYAYATGAVARLATSAYLSSDAGRSKVGFTMTGRDGQGQPKYVGGIRGIAERNTMRYYFAIESVLGSLAQPPAQRTEAQLRSFAGRVDKYPQQLREMPASDYLALKRRDLKAGTEGQPG